MIALLIGYEAVMRLIAPVAISFKEAIPIAVLGLVVNVASVLLLSGGRGGSHHHHDHHGHHHHTHADHEHEHGEDDTSGAKGVAADEQVHGHAAAHRDNNMRAAVIHVLADAAVSLLVIVGLTFGLLLGWSWMDPVVGLCGAFVIAAWSYGLIRDTGAVLLDMNPDRRMTERIRAAVETDGDRLSDLHLWRLGPGHLGAIIAVATQHERSPDYYRSLLRPFRTLSHVTVQVLRQ